MPGSLVNSSSNSAITPAGSDTSTASVCRLLSFVVQAAGLLLAEAGETPAPQRKTVSERDHVVPLDDVRARAFCRFFHCDQVFPRHDRQHVTPIEQAHHLFRGFRV